MSGKQREKKYTRTTKAYKNAEFLGSSVARNIRILCEYEETMLRLKQQKVKATVLFFGSARAKDREDYDLTLAELTEQLASTTTPKDRASVEAKLERLQAGQWMCEYYDRIRELSRRITEWSLSPDCKLREDRFATGVTRYHVANARPRLHKSTQSYAFISEENVPASQELLVCTGGGPGFMQAANQGAADVPGAKSMGMGITLPFEGGVNEFVTEELAFEYHYFFTRKFWMLYHCQAVVVAPGGVGTLDELFEVMTLRQTLKIQSDMPIVLFGAEYWNTIVNWQALARYGVVSPSDIEQLFITDSVEEAFQYLVGRLAEPEPGSALTGNDKC